MRVSDQKPAEGVLLVGTAQSDDGTKTKPKGGTATVELRHPQTEAHLCQLAVLENFAEHGLYIKFSNEEAEQLEQEALALALAESAREASMLREGDGLTRQSSNLASTPYSKEEAERIAAKLMHSEQQKAQAEQKAAQPDRPAAPPSTPPPKQSKSGGFKSLFKRKSKDKSVKDATPPAKTPSAAPASVELTPTIEKKVEHRKPEGPKKQQQQQSYSDILHSARALKAELQGNLSQYKARNASLEKQASVLESRLQKEPPTLEAANAWEAAKTQVETAEMQLDVIEEGIEELTNMERFVLKTKPSKAQATALTGEVVRQLLACLHHVAVPTKVAQLHSPRGTAAQQEATAALVAHFREQCRSANPQPLPSIPEATPSQELQTPPETLPSKPAAAAPSEAPKSKPAAAHPPQPAIEATAQLPAAPAKSAPEPQPAVPPAAASSPVEAPAATAEEASGVAMQKQHVEATHSTQILVDTAAPSAQKREDEEQGGQQGRQPQPEKTAAQPASSVAGMQPQPEKTAAQPIAAVHEEPAKEQPPKRKKAFSFLKRGRQSEPQATPLSAAAIREAEDSSPPPGPERPEALQAAPSVELAAVAATQNQPGILEVPLVPLESPKHLEPSAAAAVPASTLAPQANVSQSPAAEGASAAASSAQYQAVSTAAQPEASVATSPGADTAGCTEPASTGPTSMKALPVAKTLPEQERPVLLSPRTPREDTGGAAPSPVAKRVRAIGRLRRHMPGKGGDAPPEAATPTGRIKPNPQVDSLFNELHEAIPGGFMMQDFNDPNADPDTKHAQSAADLSPEELELVKADAERHASLISSLSKEISSFTAPDMPTLVEYVRDTNARLGVIMANEAAVLEQFPTWPQGKWDSLREAGDAYSELSQYARKEKQWLLQRGTCEEEAHKIEAFVDRVRSRTGVLEAKQGAAEARWQLQGIPWDASVYRAVRVNSLHLATLYMSRVLFEVASLEREASLPHQACLRHLAASIRTCHKIHTFAGGFEQDQSELFDKVRRLAKYYLRVMDPAWFSDASSEAGLEA